MTAKILIPPAALAVSIASARNSARVDGSDRDEEISIAVRGIIAKAEHLTGRAIINRTIRITLDAFPVLKGGGHGPICSEKSPLSSVVAVKFIGLDGIERTLDPADYIVDTVSEPGWIAPAPGTTWPATLDRINAVNVDVICGYGPTDATTPDAFKDYILARTWERFAPAGTPESPHLIGNLDSVKVWGL